MNGLDAVFRDPGLESPIFFASISGCNLAVLNGAHTKKNAFIPLKQVSVIPA